MRKIGIINFQIIVFFIFFIQTTNSYAVNNDSLRFEKIYELSQNKNLSKKERISSAKQAIEVAKKINSNKLIHKALLNLGYVYRDLSLYIETIKILQIAIDTCDFKGDSIILAKIINTQGVAFGELSQRATAIRMFKKALKMFTKHKYAEGIEQAQNNIALTYYYNHEYDKAKKNFMELIKNANKKHSTIFSAYLNLAHIYAAENDYNSAEKYYKKVLNEADINNSNIRCLALNGLAVLYIKEGKYDLAYNTIMKNQKLKNISPRLADVSCKKTLGDIYDKKHEYYKAIAEYKHALEYAGKLKLINQKLLLLKRIASVYDELNNSRKAYHYIMSAVEISDSLRLAEIKENSNLQEELFLYEQNKYKLLKEKNKIQLSEHKAKLEIIRQKQWNTGLVAVFILLLSAIIMIFKINKNKIKYINKANEIKIKYQEEIASRLEADLDNKIKQFTEISLMLSQQNEFLINIKKVLKKIKTNDFPEINEVKARLSGIIDTNKEKELFYKTIENINSQIITSLREKYPNITDKDIRLISLSKLKLSNKEISNLIGTSVKNIEMAKYRLKKKLNLSKNESIEDLLKFKDVENLNF